MCRTVATAPIENANYSNPISVAITTSPSIELRIGTESGNIARHSVYPGSTSGSGGTGPSGNFPTKQDEFLTAVTDLTGDGRPEIIIETGQFPDHAEHQVLQLTDDGLLTVLPAPTYSMWTKGLDVWTSYRTSDAGMYRCPTPGQPGVTITPIQSIVINDDGSGTLTEYLYNDTARTWTQTEQTPYLTQPGVTALPSTSFDCTDRSERQPRTPSDKNDPFTAPTEEAAPAAACDFDPTNDGRPTLIRVTTGDLSCEAAQKILREYNTSDLPATGNAAHRDNGEWHCSTPTAGEVLRTGRVGSCSASGESPPSWGFDVVLR
ncbi:MAG: hypothetical protein WAW17_02490 [Rhodococcus sp. (in: high G+C Gram-positive bacteria)]|uniref:hypothetical protein n=1 Tax=Rhodococcus sp. TaxID=1831 RepID=UPI003BAE4466